MSDPVARLNAALEGRYAIERELGEGGMATVYLSEDLKHHRKVALKVLKPELAAVVGAERFLAEIEVTANLQHPNILPLHDSGEADGFLFYVMPYVEGDTLKDRLDREHQLPVTDAVQIATDIGEALAYAHRQGVIHRDIKPANVLLLEGKPVISDFGIALAVGAAGGGRLTETGLSLGTPHYMSPEQATGDQAVGSATDTYALGSVLYEMLVGEPPYPGTTAQAVLGKIIAGKPVSATELRPSIPENVDAAVRKALEKLPADRFTSAQDFVRALGDEHFRYGELAAAGIAGAAVGPWNRLTMGLGALALVFALGFGWSLLRPEPPVRVSRQVLSTEGWAGLGREFGILAAIAPDGSSMVVPVESDGTNFQLGLKASWSTEVRSIPGTELGKSIVYSPDGEWIAYAVGRELLKRPVAGGAAVTLADDVATGTPGLAWLDDGTILYDQETGTAQGAATVMQISEDGGEPLGAVFELPEIFSIGGLPGGRGAIVIGCAQGNCGGGDARGAYLVDLDDGASERILDEVARAWYTPTSHIVYVRTDGAVFAAAFDLGPLELADSGIPLFEGVRVASQWADMLLAADGTLLYVEGGGAGASGEQQLVVADLEGNEEVLTLAPRPIPNFGVGWSPDGESVVFSSEGHIYTYNVSLGTTPRQLTFEGDNIRPVFSPDGTRVAFSSIRDGTDGADLFVKDLNENSPPSSIITLEASQYMMQWPSDTLIVFERGAAGGRDLWMVNLADPDNPIAEAYLTSETDLRRISVSPDGTLAAYSSNESGQHEIYIRSFPVPGERTIVSQGGGGRVPFWSPDGNTLYYVTGPNEPVLAARLQLDPVPVVLSTDTLPFSGYTVAPFPGSALHPDGDKFIFARNATAAPVAEGDAPEPDRLILVQNFFEELRQLAP